MTPAFDDVLRREAPHVLVALIHRHGDFDACEDALQDALVDASAQWPVDGVPDQPRGWLIRVASRRFVDRLRAQRSRAARERSVAGEVEPGTVPSEDDTLDLLHLCCHPALTPASQVALSLRAVAGLTTEQVAAAFFVPSTTMGQRISRAKSSLRDAGAQFVVPGAAERRERLGAVRHVLYLIFNEGYTTTGGGSLIDVSLTDEAIRLCRQLHARISDDETAGLLALMLITAARTPARLDADGELVRLLEQDRSLWNRSMIDEGVALLEMVLVRGDVGRFQIEASIAAVHAEALRPADTDWPQIAVLYDMLEVVAPSPAVTLGRAVAVGMADDPVAGLALTDTLLDEQSTSRNHRVHAVRGHLFDMTGNRPAAAVEYRTAARLATSLPEQRYLNRMAQAASRSTGC